MPPIHAVGRDGPPMAARVAGMARSYLTHTAHR